jgi:uncharacterized protein YndB with AHSA1/START domain
VRWKEEANVPFRTYAVTDGIKAPPEAVWPVLADVARWPEWTPTVSRVEALDGPKLEKGSRFRVTQPRLRPAVWTVTVVSPPERFTWEARSPGVHLIAEHILEQDDPHTTRLELRFTFAGILGSILGVFLGKTAREYMSLEASRLKAEVERGAASR